MKGNLKQCLFMRLCIARCGFLLARPAAGMSENMAHILFDGDQTESYLKHCMKMKVFRIKELD